MEGAFVDLLKVYGPMAMGWVVAWLLWKEQKNLLANYHENQLEDVKIKQAIATHLETLKITLESIKSASP